MLIKIFYLIACAQLCIGASINSIETQISSEIDAKIDGFRTFMANLPRAKTETVNILTDIYSKLLKNFSADEKDKNAKKLLHICMVPNATITNEALDEVARTKIGESSETSENSDNKLDNIGSDPSLMHLTKEQLTSMENSLKKKYTPEQTERIMKIFRKFRENCSTEENLQGAMELTACVMANAFHVSYDTIYYRLMIMRMQS